MFLTQEKLIKKINQDRQRGDLKRARRRALDGLERWPDDYDLAIETIQACIDLADFQQAVSILKTTRRRHPRHATRTLDFAIDLFGSSHNPFLGSFIIEALLRARNLERTRTLLRQSPKAFIRDLIKRSETRSKSGPENGAGAVQTENDLLLGLLYVEDQQYGKAVEPLARAMERSPEDAKSIGSILLEFERELKFSAAVKFYLGFASILLQHPDKAEARFFQSLEYDDPPLEKLLDVLESIEEPSANHLLLKGETLLRLGRFVDGESCIKQYLSMRELADKTDAPAADAVARCARMRELVFQRLSLLITAYPEQREVVLLFAEIAVGMGNIKQAVDALETLHRSESSHGAAIIKWIEGTEAISMSAPAQVLLARLNLEARDFPKAVEAARMAAEMDPTRIPHIHRMVIESREAEQEVRPELLAIEAELSARAGDAEGAEEILNTLKEKNLISSDELARLTGEVLKYGGVTIGGLISIIGVSTASGKVSAALPYLAEFFREYPGSHGELTAKIKDLAEEDDSRWPAVSELIDSLAEEVSLTTDFKSLQAYAHLQTGAIERAVFEYDQLLMLDGSIRYDLVRYYERAAERFTDNTTLHLALYQLHLEEGQLADAAHSLCRTLEIDPEQIRDVIKRFNELVEREPHNRGIWEAMLKSALEMNHFDLARETLKRAVTTLPEEEAASLHVYGARLSRASGNTEDTLRSLAVALSSPNADLQSIEHELKDILTRDPANADVLYLLGESLFRIGREDEAVSSFLHCLELSPTYRERIRARLEKYLPVSARPWLVSGILGEIAWSEGRHEDALRLFKTAQGGTPEHLPQLSRTFERMMLAAPDDRRLKVLYTRNLALEKRYTDAVAFLAELLATEKGMTKFAIDILLEIVGAEPAHLEANSLLARTMIETGQTDTSLEPVLRLLSIDSVPPADIESVVSEFAAAFGENCDFLIPYARLKERCGEHETSIELYRRSLGIDPGRWEEIIGELRARAWPDERTTARNLLIIDCLIAGDRNAEAFDAIRETAEAEPAAVDEIVSRIGVILKRNPRREPFTLGASLLLGAGSVDRAAELIEDGRETLEGAEYELLSIEFAEMLRSRGHEERSSALFREVLDAASDRGAVLRRIAKTYDSFASTEIAAGIGRIESGSATADEAERYVRIAIDRGDFAAALRMLGGSDLPEPARSILTARTYLDMERPILALAVLGSVPRADSFPADQRSELLYLEGIASERVGDYGRATAAFAGLLEITRDYRDCRKRIALNHTRFLRSSVTEEARVLEKTGALSSS